MKFCSFKKLLVTFLAFLSCGNAFKSLAMPRRSKVSKMIEYFQAACQDFQEKFEIEELKRNLQGPYETFSDSVSLEQNTTSSNLGKLSDFKDNLQGSYKTFSQFTISGYDMIPSDLNGFKQIDFHKLEDRNILYDYLLAGGKAKISTWQHTILTSGIDARFSENESSQVCFDMINVPNKFGYPMNAYTVILKKYLPSSKFSYEIKNNNFQLSK